MIFPFDSSQLAFLVFPVGGDAEFGDAVHLLGPDLNLERLAVLADHGSVQRLVQIGPGNRYVVLDPARNRFPQVVEDAQDGVAVLDGVGDHPDGDEIEDLIDADLLAPHLVIDAIDPFDAAFQAGRNVVLGELGGDHGLGFFDKILADRAAGFDQGHRVLIGDRVEKAECEVLEFAADARHSEPVRQRRIDLQRLARNALSSVRRQVLQGAHVVQPVGQFHKQDPDVADHRQQHLAEVFRLLLVPGAEIHLRDLGDAVDDLIDLVAELLAQFLRRHQGVFEDIVQQPGGDGAGVQFQLREDVGNFKRVR